MTHPGQRLLPPRSGTGSWLGEFVHRYGWRAYALPVLSVLTVLAIIRPTPSAHASQPDQPRTPVTQAQTHAVAAPPVDIPLKGDQTPCRSNAEAKLVLVSIRLQRAWMCTGHTQAYSTLVTTGAIDVGNGTPLGTWHVQSRETDRYLEGPGYRDFVHWWVPFNGDFGFHDSPWQTMAYGAPGYTNNGSHGCVHLPAAAMKWLYDFVDVGTTVTIQA